MTTDTGSRLADLEHELDGLRTRDRQRDVFISDLSHELRTPLTAIRGYAELLLRRLRGADPATQNALQAIVRATDQMRDLIGDLVDITAIEAGRLSVDPRATALADALRSAVERAGSLAADRGIELRTDIPDALPQVRADAARLAQILNRMLVNAIAFTPGGGSVTVAVGMRDGRAEISIRDTGVGIPADELPRVFSRAFRASTAPASHRGLGLGLYICKAIVDAHGGSVAIESAVGSGTTFRVRLPLAEDARSLRP